MAKNSNFIFFYSFLFLFVELSTKKALQTLQFAPFIPLIGYIRFISNNEKEKENYNPVKRMQFKPRKK